MRSRFIVIALCSILITVGNNAGVSIPVQQQSVWLNPAIGDRPTVNNGQQSE